MLWWILAVVGVLLVVWTLYQVTKEARLLWPLLGGVLLGGTGYLGVNNFLGAGLQAWIWWLVALLGVALLLWTLYGMVRQIKLLLPLLAGLVLGVGSDTFFSGKNFVGNFTNSGQITGGAIGLNIGDQTVA